MLLWRQRHKDGKQQKDKRQHSSRVPEVIQKNPSTCASSENVTRKGTGVGDQPLLFGDKVRHGGYLNGQVQDKGDEQPQLPVKYMPVENKAEDER